MKKTTGFTIIEILVVIVLISLLAVIMLPRFMSQAEAAKQKLVKPRMVLLEQDIAAFWTAFGRFPTQAEGLDALLKAPAGLSDKWKEPFAREDDLLDPWGNRFEYIIPGTENPSSYDIISRGRDGKAGGTGDDADVYNK